MIRRPVELLGTLDREPRSGVPRGPAGLFQRRVRPALFGEPLYDAELTPTALCPAQPHVLAYHAWTRLHAAALAAAQDPALLAIHSAYRPVSLQREIFAFRLAERRAAREAAGLPPLPEADLRRQQRRWTAQPGQSAHHTGLALDLGLYHLGPRAARRTPAYAWLAENARRFGFYPYLPEPWHWEYNPPGLVGQLRAVREALDRGEPFAHLLRAPDPMPLASPRVT